MKSAKTLEVSFDEEKIDKIFAEFDQCQRPGAVVGIGIKGKPVYRKGFGLANMELPVVLSPTCRMRIASVSKHFASLTYMLLCEEGKAGIDDCIGKYLPELHPATHKVTLRQLMGNVSGVHDAFEISWHFSGITQRVTSAELLSLYRDLDEVNAAPGTAWVYNNGGFLLLSVAIERITQQSLEDVLRERIFERVGMYASLLRRWDTDFVSESAAAHMTNSSGAYEKANFYGTAWAGEGGIVSTADDMLRWLAHMDAPVVGSAATWKTMRTSQTLTNGTSTGYGLGLITGLYRGVKTLFHPGGGLGCSAQMLKVPAAGLDVVIMVNREDVHAMALADKVLDACLPNLDPIKPRFTGPFAAGTFRSPTTGRVIQLFAKDEQQIVAIDGMDLAAEPDDHGVFWPSGIWRYYKQGVLLVGDRANPTSIQLSDYGNVDTLVRQESANETDGVPVTGSYRSHATHTEARISEETDGQQVLTVVGRFGSTAYSLERLADGIWQAKSSRLWYLGGILSFDRGATTFRFYSALRRMWGLRFLREG